MKRWGRAVILFLFLGAVANVGVAWGCAAWSPLTHTISFTHVSNYYQEYWPIHLPAGYPSNNADVQDADGKGLGVLNGNIVAYTDNVSEQVLVYSAAGWPTLSLRGCFWTTIPSLWWDGHFAPDRQDWAILLFSNQPVPHGDIRQQRMLPLRPIWPGFLANTAFYAIALWLLTLGPVRLRRCLRRHRGRCVACGYDLRGTAHERCPECGAATDSGGVAPAAADCTPHGCR